ncbi:MAG: hypothetical protein J6R30_02150 [Bacteroidales bacterium]|nr:hypothetical protein [Bacteroidales bacterium]
MKKFFKFAAVAAIAAMFVSCTEKPGPDPEKPNNQEPETPKVEITENLAFTLEVTEVEAEQAKVKVEHNGTTKDTWYAFATTEADVNKAVAAKVTELTADGGKISGLKKSKSTTITVRSLEPETDYTFIAFGITAEGQVYGTAASTTFKTVKGELKYTENAAWTVEYKGAGVVMDEEYEHTVTVTSTDNNYYFLAAYPVAEFEEKGIKAIAEDEFGAYMEYLNAFNQQYGTNYNMLAYCWQGTATDYIFVDPGVEYYALAIGVGEDGQLNGLWAKSDVIYIEEEEMTPEYAAWLGDWTITGANGIEQYVTFAKGIANQTYKMIGYEGEATAGLDVEVEWMQEEGIWVIYNQSFGTYEFTLNGGQKANGEIWFVGQTAEGDLYLEEVPVCLGGVTEDGTLAAFGYEETWENEDGTQGSYVVDSMLYLAYFTEQNQLSYISGTYQTGYPTFPMTFTKLETRSASNGLKVSARPATKLPMAYQFGSFNIL